MAVTLTIEVEREADGRWLAEVSELPGVLANGDTEALAVASAEALALRVHAERLEHGETDAVLSLVYTRAAQLMDKAPPASHKFSTLQSSEDAAPFSYAGTWDLETPSGPDRLVIAPRHGQHVQVLLALARHLEGPFGILYVLRVPRVDGHAAGRYQSPIPTGLAETEAFVRSFAPFLEGDGRHHLWLMSLPTGATLVYDNHDVIYAYGPLDEFQRILESRGLRRGPVSIPSPHEHRYDATFDEAERRLMAWWKWLPFPLHPDDAP